MSEYDQENPRETEYDTEFLLADAVLGRECERFWSSQVGRYIRGRAETEIQQLLEKLVDADPKDMSAQVDIRQDIQIRKVMLRYMSDQIQNGKISERQLEEQNG